MANLIRRIKLYTYKVVYAIRNRMLAQKGWIMAHNVQVSLNGVKKIGGG